MPLTVREATEQDAELLLGWRNDPGTRRWSRATEAVTPAAHADWLRHVIGTSTRLLFMVESSDGPVGTVRFDLVTDRVWEVSITVAPEQRGRGLSVPILAAGERALLDMRPVATLLATVNQDNAASAALFRKAGYRGASAEGAFRTLSKSLEDR